MQKANDIVSPPLVGETYLVPCVWWRDIPIPTLGPPHEDPSFAPDLGRHVHYDPRFLDLRLIVVSIRGLPPERSAMVIAHRLHGDERFSVEPMVCLRHMPDFPIGHESAPWVDYLADKHRNCKVLEDGKCPHARTDGRGLPRDAAGAWTCIHGLRWARDGALVNLPTVPASAPVE